MSEKDQVIRERMDHSGIFDFKGFYNFAHNWLIDNEYGVVEDRYSEKVSGNSRDIMIQWRAIKQLSDYFKIEFRIRFVFSGLTDVEAEIDGKRKKMNRGNVSVDLRGNLTKDPTSSWDKAPMTRFLRDVYNKYIIPGRVRNMEDIVTNTVTGYKEAMKTFLELSGKR